MLISTMNDIPGYRVKEVLGEVFGLTVRARNIGSQIGPGLKSLVGGELKGMPKNLVASRQEIIQRMVDEAQAKGADAVVAFRFDTSEMGGNWTEICAYGIAVRAVRRSWEASVCSPNGRSVIRTPLPTRRHGPASPTELGTPRRRHRPVQAA